MSGRGKRWWAPQQDFSESYGAVLQFLQRLQEHRLVGTPQTHALTVYAVPGHWSMAEAQGGLQPLSVWLKMGFDADPEKDRTRIILGRLLSSTIKAHYFLHESSAVPHEPYVWKIPLLGQPHLWSHGLLYPLTDPQGNPWTLLVGEFDLSLMNPLLPATAVTFPVVLRKDPYTWLALKRWKKWKEAAITTWGALGKPTGEAWKKLGSATANDLENLGRSLSYPRHLNEEIKRMGGVWAKTAKVWVLPNGYDFEGVQEYLNELATFTWEQFRERFPWQRRPYKPDAPPEKSS